MAGFGSAQNQPIVIGDCKSDTVSLLVMNNLLKPSIQRYSLLGGKMAD
jgi:hypothetical protein